MAELPEVYTIASDLKKNIEGYDITNVVIESGYNTYPDNKSFKTGLTGRKIVKVGRVGKNISIRLDSGEFLNFHLGMTGRLLLRPLNAKTDPFRKLSINLSKGNKKYSLRYCDMRMFGKASLLSPKEIQNLKRKHGPDLIADDITSDEFLNRLSGRRTGVKNALLEQSLFAGLGNIYATDALWLSKIHPETKTTELTIGQAEKLLKSSVDILTEGIKHRGSTLPDLAYVDIFGKIGTHQKYFRIYGKKYCPTCKTKIIYKKINGRGSYFCQICQK